VVEHLDLVGAERHQLQLGSRRSQSFDRCGQLHLLDPFGRGEDRDPLAIELSSHDRSLP
jgi:hypothetical protein